MQHGAVGGAREPGDEALDTYCWIKGTTTIVAKDKTPGAYPGVRPSGNGTIDAMVRRHAYYQWVPLALALQVGWLGTKYSDARRPA